MVQQPGTAGGQEDTDIALLRPCGGWGQRRQWARNSAAFGSKANTKGRERETRKAEKALDPIDPGVLWRLPVVVCVAMFWTNGALKSDVASIGRIKGEDLWHII